MSKEHFRLWLWALIFNNIYIPRHWYTSVAGVGRTTRPACQFCLAPLAILTARKEIGCPFVIEVRGNKINFTQPLCLPCSLLWFISSPTLYEKRQLATKRAWQLCYTFCQVRVRCCCRCCLVEHTGISLFSYILLQHSLFRILTVEIGVGQVDPGVDSQFASQHELIGHWEMYLSKKR